MLVSGIVAGIAAGVAFGGNWHRLGDLSLRLWPLLVLSFALREIGALLPRAPLELYVISLIGITTVAAANWRLPGAVLIAVGTAMNIAVVVLNSGMPYDADLVAAVGATTPTDSLHVVLTSDTRLRFLGDVIPVALIRSVYSVGDFLVAVGGFLIPFLLVQVSSEVAVARREVRSVNFALFWLAQVISRFGDPITVIALAFVTYRMTQSALLTALAVLITTVPTALFSLVAGAVADIVGHRNAMFFSDLARAVLIAAVPLLLLTGTPLLLVFILVFLSGICGAIFGPARVAIVPALVPEERLAAANSLVYASDRAVEIGGALAGGVLVATLGEAAFYVDALTFGVSSLLILNVSVPSSSRRAVWSRVLTDAVDGLRFLKRSATLWANTVFSSIAQLSNPVVNGLTPAFMVRRFANNDPVSGAVLYGAAEGAIAFGAVLGSVLLPRYTAGFGKGRLVIVGFGASGLAIVLIALTPRIEPVIFLFALLGLANVLFYVPNVTILQEYTPPEKRGGVFGARIAFVNLTWLPVILVSGALADYRNVSLLFAVAGGLTLLTAIAGAFIPAVRDVP